MKKMEKKQKHQTNYSKIWKSPHSKAKLSILKRNQSEGAVQVRVFDAANEENAKKLKNSIIDLEKEEMQKTCEVILDKENYEKMKKFLHKQIKAKR